MGGKVHRLCGFEGPRTAGNGCHERRDHGQGYRFGVQLRMPQPEAAERETSTQGLEHARLAGRRCSPSLLLVMLHQTNFSLGYISQPLGWTSLSRYLFCNDVIAIVFLLSKDSFSAKMTRVPNIMIPACKSFIALQAFH